MFFSFMTGAIAGAALLKCYENKNSDDEDGDDGDGDDKAESLVLSRGNRNILLTGQCNKNSSRTTIMKNTTGYNESADTTSGITHVNFLSDIVARLWPYLNQAGTQMIKDTIEPTFKETLPGPLSTLKFTKLDLGHVPLVLDNILVRELLKIDDDNLTYGKNRDYLQFEWDVTWNSKCDIQFATDKIGGDTFGVPIKFGVKGVSLSGRLQVIAKPLSGVLPCIDSISFAFVNPPKIELDFTGLANLADMKIKIGGIKLVDVKGMVRGIVDDILAQSLVLPNRTHAPLANHVDYRDIFCPAYKGLARIHLHSGRGFEIQKATNPFGKDDIPDVYCKIRLGVEEFWKSSCIRDNCNPKWNPSEEFHDFLYCCGHDQILEIQVWDSDSGTLDSDDRLGIAFVTIGQVLLNSNGPNGTMEIQLMKKATRKGKNITPTSQYITISLEKLVFTSKDLSSIDLAKEDGIQQIQKQIQKRQSKSEKKKWDKKDGQRVVGLNTILISHATDLPFVDETDANTFIKVWYGNHTDRSKRKELGCTSLILGCLNPQYQIPISRPISVSDMVNNITDEGSKNISIEMYHQSDIQNGTDITKAGSSSSSSSSASSTAKLIGEIIITPEDVLANNGTIRESRKINNNNGNAGTNNKYNTKLAFSVSFAGVAQSTMSKRNSTTRTDGRISTSSIETTLGNEKGKGNNGGNGDNVVVAVEENIVIDNSTGVQQQDNNDNLIRVRIVKGYGFQTEQKQFLRKADVPDIYCMIKFGSSPATWRTPTIKDEENPYWNNENETHHDYIMESMNQVISIDVWDENRRSNDDYYGNARTSVGKILLNGGTLDVEVKKNDMGGSGSGSGGSSNHKNSNSTMKEKLLKLSDGIAGASGSDGLFRPNQTNMFITVECYKLFNN